MIFLFLLLALIAKSTSLDCQCGQQQVNGKIMGGREAVPNAYPWMVMMKQHNFHMCGGVLINDR